MVSLFLFQSLFFKKYEEMAYLKRDKRVSDVRKETTIFDNRFSKKNPKMKL